MISIFDLFSIGVGPSSSHTVGPMRAGHAFVQALMDNQQLIQTTHVKIEIFGSLAHTGHGHATDKAILMGLEGYLPENIDPDFIIPRFDAILMEHQLNLFGQQQIPFNFTQDFIFNKKDLLPRHTNGMRFTAYDANQQILLQKDYYSIGGGFIITGDEDLNSQHTGGNTVPYPFDTAEELLALCHQHDMSIADIMFANEVSVRPAEEVRARIMKIVAIMLSCIERGCKTDGVLPGELAVHRRAPGLARKLLENKKMPLSHEQTDSMDWLNVYAIAVNEENAAGSRVVTAPTNGASGIIPAVLNYYKTFYANASEQKIIDFMLTAAAIAVLYKKGASLSAAEVGCQGEVGVASSMAAGALAAVLGGTMTQVASAAEIAMEHNLGLTCDPIAGLVQIPCIERNAIGAVKAVNVARLALMESGEHKKVSLDKVIETMKRTGHDMSHMYKETSLGGLAKIKVNVIEC